MFGRSFLKSGTATGLLAFGAALGGIAHADQIDDVATIAGSTYGFFETRNVTWEDAPIDSAGRTSGAKAMHFIKSPDKDFMSTSYFPQYNMQLDDLTQLKFDMLVPTGSSCGASNPRVIIVLEGDADVGTGSAGKQVEIYPAQSGACPINQWFNVNFLTNASWTHGSQAAAHAAVSLLDPNYRIWTVRVNYDSANEVWVDKEYVNASQLQGPFDDTTYLQQVAAGVQTQDQKGIATTAGIRTGFYETRNVKWENSPADNTGRTSGAKAMHFSPTSHPIGQNFMSTSYFPQYNMQLDDLTELKFEMLLPIGSTCTGGGPRVSIVLTGTGLGTDNTNGKQVSLNGTPAICPTNTWLNVNYLGDPGVQWNASSIGGGSGETQATAHGLAALKDPDYKIAVIRINYDNGSMEAWFDKEFINGAQLQGPLDDTTYLKAPY